jgi:uncharacterized protein
VRASNYNFAVPTSENSWLLFNTRTGRLLELTGSQSKPLVESLTGKREDDEVIIDRESLDLLASKEFIVEDSFDELSAIKSVYWTARHDAPVVVTITTTLDCNLGCFYCYEERSGDSLLPKDVPFIVETVRALIASSKRSSIHVDWYGGEPTLNLPFLKEASIALQSLCQELRIRYSASIISNGTAWPNDVADFVATHRIRQAQITFDGMKRVHDQRRRFTRKADAGRSSFEEAASLISSLVNLCRVDIRFNVDEKNKGQFRPFVEFAVSQGWFNGSFHASFQPARVAPYTERSRFVERIGLSNVEFDQLKRDAFTLLPLGTMEEPESPDGVASPRRSVCAALSNNAVVVGADRNLYRCGLQVSEPGRAVGRLGLTPFNIINNMNTTADERWWREFDPTLLSSCSVCSFLPICLGGCPKKQLERDAVALEEQSMYWRENLPRLICKAANIPEVFLKFTDRDQFRSTS